MAAVVVPPGPAYNEGMNAAVVMRHASDRGTV